MYLILSDHVPHFISIRFSFTLCNKTCYFVAYVVFLVSSTIPYHVVSRGASVAVCE